MYIYILITCVIVAYITVNCRIIGLQESFYCCDQSQKSCCHISIASCDWLLSYHPPSSSRRLRADEELVTIGNKLVRIKWFGQYVCKLSSASNMFKQEGTTSNMFSDEMNIDFNMFCVMMKHWILGHSKSIDIVTVQV